MSEKNLKCVIIGDASVGKTSLAARYIKNEFVTDYTPTVMEVTPVIVPYKEEIYNFFVYDTSGQEDYERLRTLTYVNASICLLCFAINNENSFANIRDKWYMELKTFYMGPFILVGTKIDLRNDKNEIAEMKKKNQNFISKERGTSLAYEIGAEFYIECSSKSGENVETLFRKTILEAIIYEGHYNESCSARVMERVLNTLKCRYC